MKKNDVEKPYTFRTLEASDVFLMFKILSKVGIGEFSEAFGTEKIQGMIGTMTKKDGTQEVNAMMGISVALEIANVVIGGLPKCEKEVYQMLASVSGMKENEIRTLPMVSFTGMVIDFIKKPEFKDFIEVVSTSFK